MISCLLTFLRLRHYGLDLSSRTLFLLNSMAHFWGKGGHAPNGHTLIAGKKITGCHGGVIGMFSDHKGHISKTMITKKGYQNIR